MKGIETQGWETAMLLVGILLIIISFPFRAYMFRWLKGDSTVSDLLEGTSIIGSDWLFLRLLRRWHQLSNQAKRFSAAYAILLIGGAIMMLLTLLAASTRVNSGI